MVRLHLFMSIYTLKQAHETLPPKIFQNENAVHLFIYHLCKCSVFLDAHKADFLKGIQRYKAARFMVTWRSPADWYIEAGNLNDKNNSKLLLAQLPVNPDLHL